VLTAGPVGAAEARRLFAPFETRLSGGAVLAVSGGPDSLALMHLAATVLGGRFPLFVASVDHGLRDASRGEAERVAALAEGFGLPGRVLRWTGDKPKSGVQARARAARYGLLAAYARESGAGCILTAHTLDDQAETVLMRLAHGSGPRGLGAMPAEQSLGDIALLRPLLGIARERLGATCEAAGLVPVNDPSNADERFERVRIRRLRPLLTAMGLDDRRLARLALRLQRQEAALVAATDAAAVKCLGEGPSLRLDIWRDQPEEVRLRLLERAIVMVASEKSNAAKLERLEALERRIMANLVRRATISGCLVHVSARSIDLSPEPPRRRGRAGRTPLRPAQLGFCPPAP